MRRPQFPLLLALAILSILFFGGRGETPTAPPAPAPGVCE